MSTMFLHPIEKTAPPAPRRHAFTIIELLVVIAIIAILAGLLLPVVGRARAMARLSNTKTNMKSIQVACQVYMTVYAELRVNGLPPDAFSSHSDWGDLRAEVLPTLIVKGYLDGTRRAYSSYGLTTSISDITNYGSDYTIGIHSAGSLIAGDEMTLELAVDPYYDPLAPGYHDDHGKPNWLGPFGPRRNAIWVYHEADRDWRIRADVAIAIGSRGPDRTWQTDAQTNITGFICDSSGENGDLFIIMKEDGTWIPFPDGIITD